MRVKWWSLSHKRGRKGARMIFIGALLAVIACSTNRAPTADQLVGTWIASRESLEGCARRKGLEWLSGGEAPHFVLGPSSLLDAFDIPVSELESEAVTDGGEWKVDALDGRPRLLMRFTENGTYEFRVQRRLGRNVVYWYLGDPDSSCRIEYERSSAGTPSEKSKNVAKKGGEQDNPVRAAMRTGKEEIDRESGQGGCCRIHAV